MPGYIHALSYLIFRDSVITAGDEFTKEDFQKLYNRERLIRTEITALIGLWLKGDRSTALPDALKIQVAIHHTDQLLAELHSAMLAPAHRDFMAAMQSPQFNVAFESPLGRATALKESIFYSGESAFAFQYSDFARQRFASDAIWLQKNHGFDIETAVVFFEKLIAYLTEQMSIRFSSLRKLPMSDWTMLPIFCFTEEEAIEATGLAIETVRSVIATFSVSPESNNDRYIDLFSFNEAAVLPFVRLDDGRIAFLQEYVGTEALYNSPSYWMRNDPDYSAQASQHRGEFAEALSYTLIQRVFPSDRIHRNIVFKPTKKVTSGEVDLLLVQGKRAFVFQLKSKGLTELARTGNELAVNRDFSAAVQHAYDQAVSCIELLTTGVSTYKNEKPFAIPHIDAVEEFYPICVTSENYPALSFQVGQFLKRSNNSIVKDPIIIDVFTLDAITEFLRSPLYMTDFLVKPYRCSVDVLPGVQEEAIGRIRIGFLERPRSPDTIPCKEVSYERDVGGDHVILFLGNRMRARANCREGLRHCAAGEGFIIHVTSGLLGRKAWDDPQRGSGHRRQGVFNTCARRHQPVSASSE